jgi:hypothetical protein
VSRGANFAQWIPSDTIEFAVLASALDDNRRLIAAGKVQRWDVVKWGVTVNLALAALSASLPTSLLRSFALFVLAGLASAAAAYLVQYYNRRMTEARKNAVHLAEMLTKKGIQFDQLVGGPGFAKAYAAGEKYDYQEFIMFRVILAVAPLSVFVRYSIEHVSAVVALAI